MKITTNKQLDALIKMLRRNGVTSIKLGGLELQLGQLPIKGRPMVDHDAFPEAQVIVPKFNGEFNDAPDVIKTEELTEEQLRDWSVKSEEVN